MEPFRQKGSSIASLSTFIFKSVHDIFSVVDPNVRVGVKTTSVCRTFDFMKGHSIVKMQVKFLLSFICTI